MREFRAHHDAFAAAEFLMDYLKTQFLEIIQWQDDSRDTLSFRFPDEDKEIKRGAQLIDRRAVDPAVARASGPVDGWGPRP